MLAPAALCRPPPQTDIAAAAVRCPRRLSDRRLPPSDHRPRKNRQDIQFRSLLNKLVECCSGGQMWEKPPSVTIPLGAARWYEATDNCASLPRSGRGYLHCGSDVFRIFARNGDGHRVRRHLEAEELG